MAIEIPNRLKNFNFVLLAGETGKEPFEKGWQNKIHKSDDPQLIEHLNTNKNYGVNCGKMSPIIVGDKNYFLIVVDFDKKEIQDKILHLLPETFTTTSGSPKNCYHLWFACDNDKSFKILDKDTETLADIQGTGKQIVCVGSKHKSGSTYSIVKDIPFAFIHYSELQALLMPYDQSPKKESRVQKVYTPKGIGNNISDSIMSGTSMEQILRELGVDTSKNPTSCPFHSSKGGKCLGWNNETAHCFHCDGSWNKFSLVKKAKNLTDKETFEWLAEKAGLSDELIQSRSL